MVIVYWLDVDRKQQHSILLRPELDRRHIWVVAINLPMCRRRDPFLDINQTPLAGRSLRRMWAHTGATFGGLRVFVC